MQNSFSSLKNKIIKRHEIKSENNEHNKSTNINILLNRVSVR
jgi:hypothetical protein